MFLEWMVKNEKSRSHAPKAEKVYLADAATGAIWNKESAVTARFRSLLRYSLPSELVDGKKVIHVNADDPLGMRELIPGPTSPLCTQCGMDKLGSRCPYISAYGSENPLITIITDSVTQNQDSNGELITPNGRGNPGGANYIYQIVASAMDKTGIDPDKDVRWLAMTRCAVRGYKRPNLSTKANWCRYHIIQDLKLHPPKLIMPFGTVCLGALSHKSNAFDWQGKILTYRGWPDDWLTEPKFMLPRENPVKDGPAVVGHPVFGVPPTAENRICVYPLQSYGIIRAQLNDRLTEQWKDAILKGLHLATTDIKPLKYVLPHYKILTDPDSVIAAMQWLIDHKGTLVAFDTETNGLKQFCSTGRVVFMMFRYIDPESGEPVAVGFPWNYPTSPLYEYIAELTPWVIEGLGASLLIGHNLAFDLLWVASTLGAYEGESDSDKRRRVSETINKLAPRGLYDTWHMAYTAKQTRGSLGLERLAYDYVPDLAGYEEEMTLLIKLHGDLLDPASKKGGHYAMCPRDKWETHLKPYVMGDVEVTYRTYEKLAKRLETRPTYEIPLADPANPGAFRWFMPPSRAWVYQNIMSPANALLTKMMARGMFVNVDKLHHFENQLPNEIEALKNGIKTTFPQVGEWIEHRQNQPKKEGSDEAWEFDLESKDVLRELLFEFLRLPIQRLTKAGQERFPTEDDVEQASHEDKLPYAAVDKFTLNKLAAENEIARPLLDYRKKYKLYTTYVRPLLNCYDSRVDKKQRDKEPHLWLPENGGDCLLHTQFMLTGTRGGRLSSRDPNLQQLPSDSSIKSMFTSRFGERGCLYAGDLSQIELRLLAAVCGDKNMLHAYNNGMDLHTLTTSKIFKLPYETFSKDHMAKLQEQGKSDEAKKLDLKRRIGKCVDPLTLLSIDGKIERIGNLHSGRKNDTFYAINRRRVQIPKGNDTPINQFYSSGVKPRMLVCASQGAVACSYNHRFQLADGSLKQAQDLVKGDVLMPVETLRSFETTQPIPFSPFSGKEITGSFCIHPTDNLAYVLGLFYGDGTCHAGAVSISTGGTPDYFEWQDSIAMSLSKAGFATRINRTCASKGGKYGLVTFGSHRVIDVLSQLGAIAVGDNYCKRTLQVPTWLLNSSPGTKLSFLAGLIDTDGSVSKRGDISICTKSWSFAQDIMVMLRSIGIVCSLCPGWNKTYSRYYYEVNIAKRSNSRFKSLLRHKAKADRITFPKFGYKREAPNVVKLIEMLPEGELVDISIDYPHLYLANGFATHNTANFLTGYGGGAFGLQTMLASNKIYIELEECERILASFFEAYPALREYLGAYKAFIEGTGVAVSLTGRVRVFDEVFSRDSELVSKALRSGCNHLIQATASDIMLVCLCFIEEWMRRENLESILMLTVHDSLVIDAVKTELPKIHDIVDNTLNNIPEVLQYVFGDTYDTSWIIVPLAGDCEVGLDYKNMHKIPGKGSIDWDKLLAAEE